MGLTGRIRLAASLLLVLQAVTTAVYMRAEAGRLARDVSGRRLRDAVEAWEALQTSRHNALKLGVRVLGNEPAFKAAIATDQKVVFDMLSERGADLKADFFIATDPAGIVIAHSDGPTAQGDDLSKDPIVRKPLEGEESGSIWRQGDRLFNAVSVPMRFGQDLVGVLIAGYSINETLADEFLELTHCQVAFLVRSTGRPPQVTVSSLGPKEGALKAALGRPELTSPRGSEPFEIELDGERHVGAQLPLRAASGELVGSVVVLRSLVEDTALIDRPLTRVTLIVLVATIVTLALAFLLSPRIAAPGR